MHRGRFPAIKVPHMGLWQVKGYHTPAHMTPHSAYQTDSTNA